MYVVVCSVMQMANEPQEVLGMSRVHVVCQAEDGKSPYMLRVIQTTVHSVSSHMHGLWGVCILVAMERLPPSTKCFVDV